jgi:hypothetical protein
MTYRVRRSLHRVTKSLSVKKKSPMSVWRRSMFSTRKTQDRFGAWYRKPEVAAAAAVAEAAEVVGVAEAVVDAADAAVAVAVCRGVLAASARPDRLPIALTNAGHFGRDRQSRPGQSMSPLKCVPFTRGGAPAHNGQAGLQPCREMQAAELDEAIPALGEYALQKRTRVASKVRVLTA